MKQIYTVLIVLLCANYLRASSPEERVFPDFHIVDVKGVEHKINQYLTSGKSIILNFSSTWCRPCWNYQNTGTLQQVWEEHGPDGVNDVVVILIEADKNTCEDCLYGQEDCNDFTYGDWSTSYPVSNLEDHDENIIKRLNITKFPSIFAISAKDQSVTEVGQLSYTQWESWLNKQQVREEISQVAKLIKRKKLNETFVAYHSKVPVKEEWVKGSGKKKDVSISWNVFPNPCVDQLMVKSDRLIQSPVEIAIYDTEGSRIYSQQFEFYFQNWSIDMTEIPPGSYIVKVKSEAGDLTKRILNVR